GCHRVKTNKLHQSLWPRGLVYLAWLAILPVACTSAGNTSPIVNRDSSPAQHDSKSYEYHFASGSSATDIPFELNANKIYLSVRVNDKGLLSFILDSGAAFDVLDEEWARTLNLKLSDEATVKGAGEGSVQTAVGTGLSLNLKGLEIVKPSINVLPIHSSISYNEGRAVDGLL